jgi:hypothetical protein
MIADALKQAQGLGKDNSGFWVAPTCFHTPDVRLASFPVQDVKFTLRLDNFCCQDGILFLKGLQGSAIDRAGAA